MLKDNIKAIRKSKGLSQDELATKLHVVRQTVSKWERGSSIPDARMLVKLAQTLDTSTNVLLEETPPEPTTDDLPAISAKLETISAQLLKKKQRTRKIIRWSLIALSLILIITFVTLIFLESPYLGWDYSDPENAVLGTALHSLEWLFVRVAPILLVASVVGIILTRKRD